MSDGVRQWKRKAQVIVGKSGTGLLIEDLKITFEIGKTVESTPNHAIIKIYNLNPDNEAKIKKEFDDVLVNAGYEGHLRMIFRGNIKHVYRYRDGTDIITEIEAGDGDRDYRGAIVNATLAAGTTNNQVVDHVVGSMSSTSKGEVQLKDKARVRGKVISGNARDVLHSMALESGASWSIQDGVLHIVKTSGVLPGTAIVLNSETGLLGAPEINDKGIAAKCLLNPEIRVNGTIKLDNNSIKAKRESALNQGKKEQEKKDPVRLDPDGIYKVIKIVHKGDTRGQDWISEILCVGIGQPVPQSGKKKSK